MQEERATNDPLNGLVLRKASAGATWRCCARCATTCSRSARIYTADTVTGVMLRNSAVAAALFRRSRRASIRRFQGQREQAMAESVRRGRATPLKAVASLFDDEILRALDNLVSAALRTNFYQRPERPVIAIKIECAQGRRHGVAAAALRNLRALAPLEGIHLRGGKVARGGIRWSDRHDDFRTEILGLMKTQMVKNAIIVPVGSKGGFVLKGDVPPRPALDAYLVDRYREFVSGLLDVTDNLVDGEVVHPPEVVRHDDDDPYLVVAADKGTAHLSDTANQVSAQYGFWLGDAFASGGSNGYDHKKEGITARGAWECVSHHFRKLGVDVQTQPFTSPASATCRATCSATARCAAGDQAGGGLQSLHIFLDPTPDPETQLRASANGCSSCRDRPGRTTTRRSSARAAASSIARRRSIPLSAEARALLGIDEESASGEEVIRRILTAKVDLLYNGGIGTYVKSSTEDRRRGRRSRERSRPRGCERSARARGRRRRQPRPDAARPPRVLGRRRRSEHRRDRQLGRRRHVGP